VSSSQQTSRAGLLVDLVQ